MLDVQTECGRWAWPRWCWQVAGRLLAKCRIDDGAEGFEDLLKLLAEDLPAAATAALCTPPLTAESHRCLLTRSPKRRCRRRPAAPSGSPTRVRPVSGVRAVARPAHRGTPDRRSAARLVLARRSADTSAARPGVVLTSRALGPAGPHAAFKRHDASSPREKEPPAPMSDHTLEAASTAAVPPADGPARWTITPAITTWQGRP
ncbi:hypothetical protein GCM10009527_073160 [Actinomadura nitritigenes]